MTTTLGRALVTDVVTRWGLSVGDAEHVVGYVLEQVVEDLARCRQAMVEFDSPVALGVGTAVARLMSARDRTRRRRSAP